MCKLRIRDLREDHDLNQKQIAELLKTTQQQYSKYEKETQEIPVRHIQTLASYYNVSTDYILGNTNDKTPPQKREQEKKEQKKYSPEVIQTAEAIREMFRERKGREPNQKDLLIIKKFIDTFINDIK